jgi:hypothetical protein
LWWIPRSPSFDSGRDLFPACEKNARVAPLGLEIILVTYPPFSAHGFAATPTGWANLCRASGAGIVDSHVFLIRPKEFLERERGTGTVVGWSEDWVIGHAPLKTLLGYPFFVSAKRGC